jgi:DNA-binding IclR family transcriptional regulator
VAGNSGEPGRTVAAKVAAILTSFVFAEEQSLSEVARSADLSVSTAHRLLMELVARQLLERGADAPLPARLVLAPHLHMHPGRDGDDRGLAAPVLYDLAEATGFRIRLGVLVQHQVTYIEKRPDSAPMTGFTRDAALPAATSALGRALLAYAPSAAVDALHGMPADRSGRPTNDLRRSLTVVRHRQMAINPGGGDDGHCCFAKPVFGPGGHVVAALGMTVTDLDAFLRPLIGVLAIAAGGLARELSGSRRSVHASTPQDVSLGDSTGTFPRSARHARSEYDQSRSVLTS